jgi:hypothetical protein
MAGTMQEYAYKAWLGTLPIKDKTSGNQLSRMRRLEAAFGDLDSAFEADGLASVLAALQYGPKDQSAGKPLPSGIISTGKFLKTMATLRHAARKYRTFRLQQSAGQPAVKIPTNFEPLLQPKQAATRNLKPTGFWIFQANPSRWDANAWAASGEASLLYYVSVDDRDLIQTGDLGVIRRTVHRNAPAALLALVEVVEATKLQPEPDPKFFVDPKLGAKSEYRVRLERLTTFDVPMVVASLPEDDAFDVLRKGLQRTTTPLPTTAFAYLAEHAQITPLDLATLRGSRSQPGLRALQAMAAMLPPKSRTVVSRRIERGPIGDKVKAARNHRCQICGALGQDPVAFIKSGGGPYAEAHHVILVSTMLAGVLDATNVMVLCPNHHRQAHYGVFEVLSADAVGWIIKLDDIQLTIRQTKIW